MERPPAVLLYVQHLLGLGHLARAMRLAQALLADGFAVTVAMGGVGGAIPVPAGVRVVQLDPIRVAPEAMGVLLTPGGQLFDAERQAARRDALLALFDELQPDALILEAYPFGRRAMRFELLPLLRHAQGRALVAVSIRDILQENRKPGRDAETCDTIEAFVDLVLVHGDEAVTPLSLTFPLAARITERTVYTGMIGPPPPVPISEHDIIVSVGGGAVGERLLRTAADAVSQSAFSGLTSLLLTGPNLPDQVAEDLRARRGVDVQGFVADLPARLAGARLSVSQAGYNTVADLIAARCPAVLVPFAAGGETEQTRRAAAMAAAGRALVVDEKGLNAERLADAIAAGLALPRPPEPVPQDGALISARLIRARLR